MSLNTDTMTLPSIDHLGIVVKDADKIAEFLSRLFGIGPWNIFDYSVNKDKVVIGEPFRLRIAAAKIGQMGFEFLQPVEGKSIWADFLETHGEGLHHVAFNVSNWDERFAYLQEQGAELLASARAADKFKGRRWAYFDTKSGGLIVEIMDNYGF